MSLYFRESANVRAPPPPKFPILFLCPCSLFYYVPSFGVHFAIICSFLICIFFSVFDRSYRNSSRSNQPFESRPCFSVLAFSFAVAAVVMRDQCQNTPGGETQISNARTSQPLIVRPKRLEKMNFPCTVVPIQ